MRRNVVILVGLLGLGACGLVPDVQPGETQAQLERQLGPPASSTTAGDAQILTYHRVQTAVLPGTGPTPWDAPFTWWTGPAPPGVESQPPELVTTGRCTLTYRIVGGVVESSQHSGSGC